MQSSNCNFYRNERTIFPMADVGKETWPHKILHQSPLGNQGGQLAKIGSPANCQLKWCVSEHTWSKADTEYALNCNLA